MFVFYFFTWESWLQIQNLYIYDDIVSSGKDACMQISFEFQHILEILTLVVFMEVCRSESNSSKKFYFDIWLQCSSYNFSKILKSRQLFGIFKMLEDMYKQIFVIFDFLPSLIIRICHLFPHPVSTELTMNHAITIESRLFLSILKMNSFYSCIFLEINIHTSYSNNNIAQTIISNTCKMN